MTLCRQQSMRNIKGLELFEKKRKFFFFLLDSCLKETGGGGTAKNWKQSPTYAEQGACTGWSQSSSNVLFHLLSVYSVKKCLTAFLKWTITFWKRSFCGWDGFRPVGKWGPGCAKPHLFVVHSFSRINRGFCCRNGPRTFQNGVGNWRKAVSPGLKASFWNCNCFFFP